jgi:F5/8 type C domain
MTVARMSSATVTQSHSTAAPSVKEWFWRGDALKDAKAASTVSSLRRERLRRARLAAEFAGRMIDPAEPLYDGSALPLALSLYREAAYWVLLSRRDDTELPTLHDLLAGADAASAELSDVDLALVKDVLGEKTFVQSADEPEDELRRQALASRTFVNGLIRGELAADRRVTRLLQQRVVRIGIVTLAVGAALFAVTAGLQRALRGPDLAAGKAWRASSKAFDCKPAEMNCGGARTAIFLHTREEASPWVEIDLGAPTKFSRVEVENREDCCQDRAVPLVVETRDDGTEPREVARTTEVFRDWAATFEPVTARYVRVRVDRRSYLHLVRVGVRAR